MATLIELKNRLMVGDTITYTPRAALPLPPLQLLVIAERRRYNYSIFTVVDIKTGERYERWSDSLDCPTNGQHLIHNSAKGTAVLLPYYGLIEHVKIERKPERKWSSSEITIIQDTVKWEQNKIASEKYQWKADFEPLQSSVLDILTLKRTE